jgi:hypothetical protein
MWYDVKTDVSNAFVDDFSLPKLLESAAEHTDGLYVWKYHGRLLDSLLKPEWLSYMSNLGLDVDSCVIFYREAGQFDHTIHTDASPADDITFAINWTSKECTSVMAWFSGEQYKLNTSNLDSYYFGEVDIADVCKDDLVDECIIGTSPVLVNIRELHTVYPSRSDRWTISLRVSKNSSLYSAPWSVVVDYFKNKDLIRCRS